MKRILLLTIAVAAIGSAAAQSVQYRLIAKSAYKCDSLLNLRITDSATYNYSGSRGSNIKTGTYLYDSLVNYQNLGAGLVPAQLYYRTYGDSDRINTHSYAKRVGNAWRNVSRSLYSYITNKMYDSTTADSWDTVAVNWKNEHRYKYYYTGTQLDSIVWRKNFGGVWYPELRELYAYNVGNITVHNTLGWNDSTQNWDSLQSETYAYNSSSKLEVYTQYVYNADSGMLRPTAMQFYDYNAQGRVAEHTYSYWSELDSLWQGNDQHFYTYTAAGNPDVEIVNIWDEVGMVWNPFKRIQYSYDAQGNILNVFSKKFSGWTFLNSTLETWTYNANGLSVSDIFSAWNDAGNKWIPMIGDNAETFYYYEAIPDAVVMHKYNNAGMQLFPNPTYDYLNISLKWNQANPFTVCIYDMQGRVVYTALESAALGYKRTLSIAGFTPGSYIIKASNGDEEMTKHLIIGNH